MNIINTVDAAKKLGLSKSTFHRRAIQDPGFPKQVKLSSQRVGYIEGELDDYIEKLATARTT